MKRILHTALILRFAMLVLIFWKLELERNIHLSWKYKRLKNPLLPMCAEVVLIHLIVHGFGFMFTMSMAKMRLL